MPESEKAKAKLKNGAEVSAYHAIILLGDVRDHLHIFGEEAIEELHGLCAGVQDRIKPQYLERFIQDRYLLPKPDGTVEPPALLRDVLLSAFYRSPDGIVLVSPFLPTEENKVIVEKAEAELHRVTMDIFNRDYRDEDEGDHGRGKPPTRS